MVLLNNWQGGYRFPCLWQSNKKLKPVDFHSNSAGLTYPEERSKLASELHKEKQRGTLRAIFKNSPEFKPLPQHPAAGQGDPTPLPQFQSPGGSSSPQTPGTSCRASPCSWAEMHLFALDLLEDQLGMLGLTKAVQFPFFKDEKTHGNSTKALVVVGYLDTTHNTRQVKSKEIIDLLKSKKQPPRF